MNVVVTVQEDDALPAVVEVFQADATVLLKSCLDTDVAVLHGQFIAALTLVTVKAGRFAAHFADAALVAVIDSLLDAFVVVERAHLAVILAEWNGTVLASRRLRLDCVAVGAFYVGYRMSIDSVILTYVSLLIVTNLVVTEPTRIAGPRADGIRALEPTTS